MKKASFFSYCAIMSLLFLNGCAPTTVSPAPVSTENTAADVVLTLIGEKTMDLTLSEIKAMPAVEGQAGIKSSTGKITPPTSFKGVLLTDLVDLIGGLNDSLGVQIEAVDGYAMTYSGDQVLSGGFIAYDPATGDEVTPDGKLQVIVAYEMDGKALDPVQDGSLRLVVISEKNDQVTDGHWSIKWVRTISLRPMAAEWSLVLDGALQDDVDRGSFESCSTGNCHPSAWVDGKAQTWSGTSLWLVVGLVDDKVKHDDVAFDRELAEAGYSVELVARDGYSVTLDSARITDNDGLMLANQVNGNPLNEDDFPLKLVGEDVQKGEGISAIEKIILHMNAPQIAQEPTSAPETPQDTPEPETVLEPLVLPDGVAILITGMVTTEQSWSLDDLKAMDVVQLSVEHPKKGPQDVEGVRLSSLFSLVDLESDASLVTFTAADGFTAQIDITTLQSCGDCLLTFGDEDSLKLSMPGMESSLWVKDLIGITIQ